MEAEHLFFVVCDVMFLHAVKGVSFAQFSFLISFSLLFSVIVQYPLLKCIHAVGTRRSVQLGSLFFLLSALCFTFAPNYGVVIAGGIAKCIGFTFNLLGPALLKEKLVQDGRDNEYVAFQSDANSATAVLMMITSLICGVLFVKNVFYPMAGCILLSFAGVIVSFQISCDEQSSGEIIPAAVIKRDPGDKKYIRNSVSLLMFAAFAIFTGLSGTGLAYSRMNIQELLSVHGSGYAITLLSIASTLVFLFRFL